VREAAAQVVGLSWAIPVLGKTPNHIGKAIVVGKMTVCAKLAGISPLQVRKNTNQSTPRIRTANPVEASKRASMDGPGSACRASVGVSMIWRCRRVAMLLDFLSWRADPPLRCPLKQRMISDDVPCLEAIGTFQLRVRSVLRRCGTGAFWPAAATSLG
jgi:hypothetical protein